MELRPFDEILEEYEIRHLWNRYIGCSEDKPYHGYEHTEFVIRTCDWLSDNIENQFRRLHLIVAAMFHDAGHYGPDDEKNIGRAIWLVNDNCNYNQPSLSLSHLAAIILDTKHPYEAEPKTVLGMFLRDADLCQTYHWGLEETTKRLKAEGYYEGMTEVEKLTSQSEFLEETEEWFSTMKAWCEVSLNYGNFAAQCNFDILQIQKGILDKQKSGSGGSTPREGDNEMSRM